MAEMTAAAAAMGLGADHEMAAVDRRFDRSRLGVIEARPAGAALEFLLRLEQSLAAAGAVERTRTLLEIEGAAAGPLGSMLAHDVILLGRQNLAPFLLRVRDGVLLGSRRAVHGLPPVPNGRSTTNVIAAGQCAIARSPALAAA